MVPDITCRYCGTLNPGKESFCENCGASLNAAAAQSAPTPVTLLLRQRYRIIEKLGSGGFGTVYKVEDTQLNNRPLAAKKLDLNAIAPRDQQAAINNFKQEASMLATLQHPNLPRIYEHFTENNDSYLIMDFIEGETLEEYLERLKSPVLPVLEVIRIGIQLAIVLDYLHTRQPAIIFRDLKPDNIMLTAGKHLYLIDFGIARHFKPGQSQDTIRMGAPGYASPELVFTATQTTIATDTYSLGAMLYVLLTGNVPTYKSPTPLASSDKTQSELQHLVMSMLAYDKADRPASMSLVKQRLQKIARELQQPARVSGIQSRPAATSSGKAGSGAAPQKNAQSTQKRQAAAPGLNTVRFVPPTQPVASAPPPEPGVQGELYHSYTHASQKIHALAWSPDGGSLAAAGEEPEQIYIWQALTQQAVSAYKVHARLIRALAWSPDSQLLVSGGNDRVARVWQPGKSAQQTYTGHTGWVQALAWSPAGQLIASGGSDEQVHLWEATNCWARLIYRGHRSSILAVAWSPDGKRAASADERGVLQVWEATSGKLLATCAGHLKAVNALAWSPDGRQIVSGSLDRTARVWDTGTGQCLTTYTHHQRTVTSVAWSVASGHIASASTDQSVQIWQPQSGDTLYTYRGHSSAVNTLAYSPDGNYLASAGESATVQVWWAK